MPVITSAEEAVRNIPKGHRIFIGSGAAAPVALLDALVTCKESFRDNEIVHLLTLGRGAFAGPDLAENFRDNSFFIGKNVRSAVQEGHADYTPIFLSEIPALLQSPSFQVAAALVNVTPPDRHGMCSLGVSVDIVKAGVESAKIKIAQVNKNMPRTFGNSFIPYKDFDYIVEADSPLPELETPEITKEFEAIGKHAASLVKDGSVLQMGIGGIPNAVLQHLHDRNDLGIHTEMFSDGLISLIKDGNINNRNKKILNGRTLTSFVMGTQKLYDFVNENPLIEFYPSDFTNDPFIIAKNDNVVAINSALQIDLSGQISADSIGHKFYSGIGGQVDFVRGAARSKGGKAIIAFPSTTKNYTISRIAGQLSPGAGVVTSRGDVHYVVTEYGVAFLHGKTVRQRAIELIQIAHPKFRDKLLDFVKNNKYVYFDQKILEKGIRYPAGEEEIKTFGTHSYRVRPVKITDERRLQDLYYSLDPKSLYERFSYLPSAFSRHSLQQFVNLDYENEMAFCALESGDYDSKMIAFGHYACDKDGECAEVDFVVANKHQSKGIGTYLGKKLLEYAKRQGIKSLKAYVQTGNVPMQRAIAKLGKQAGSWEAKTKDDMMTFIINL